MTVPPLDYDHFLPNLFQLSTELLNNCPYPPQGGALCYMPEGRGFDSR
jgi:hypothetical protein